MERLEGEIAKARAEGERLKGEIEQLKKSTENTEKAEKRVKAYYDEAIAKARSRAQAVPNEEQQRGMNDEKRRER